MFNFFDMSYNYEERKVDRFENGAVIVDTCMVTDSDKDYETGICHPNYNDGKWVIVGLYDTKEEAQKGHDKWVQKITAKRLPKSLTDVSTSGTAYLCDLYGKSWRAKGKK